MKSRVFSGTASLPISYVSLSAALILVLGTAQGVRVNENDCCDGHHSSASARDVVVDDVTEWNFEVNRVESVNNFNDNERRLEEESPYLERTSNNIPPDGQDCPGPDDNVGGANPPEEFVSHIGR
jgi:hypothetical protein